MKIKMFLICILIINIQIYAQTDNDYQRFVLIRENMELKVESILKYWFENVENKTLYTLNQNLAVEFNFLKNHSVKANAAYTISFYDNHEARNRIYYAPNDIGLSYEYLKQINHLNIFFGPQITIPLGITNEYSVREEVFTSSDGRYTVGGTFALNGIRDPIVWSGELKYDIGLPKKERFGTTWLPGIIRMTVGLTDLVNDSFGFSFGLQQNFILSKIYNGKKEPDSFSFLSVYQLEVFTIFEKNYVRTAIIAPVYPANRPVIIAVTYGHIFKQ